jgi:hypothetical protein
MKLTVCMALIFTKLTRSTWMACTQSCLSPWTRNRATPSFWWYPFLGLFCRTALICSTPAPLKRKYDKQIQILIYNKVLHWLKVLISLLCIHSTPILLINIQAHWLQNKTLMNAHRVPWIWLVTWTLRKTILVLCPRKLVPEIHFANEMITEKV